MCRISTFIDLYITIFLSFLMMETYFKMEITFCGCYTIKG